MTTETHKIYRVGGYIITRGDNCWNVTVSGSVNLMTYAGSFSVQDIVNLVTQIKTQPLPKRRTIY